MKNLFIRKATPEDDGGIKTLCQSFNPEDYVPEIWPVWMAGQRTVNLVALLDGVIIGCVYGEIIAGCDSWSQGLRVHQNFRKIGIGTALVAALEHELVSMGGTSVFANISATNTASLSTVSKRRWRIAAPIIRRRIKPETTFYPPSDTLPRNRITRVVFSNPTLASCKKEAVFKRAYFSMNQTYLDQALNQNAIRVAPDGRSYAMMDLDTDPKKLIWVVVMSGTIPGIQWLLESFMGEAARSQIELIVDADENKEIQSLMDTLNFAPADKDGMYVVVKKELFR